MSATIKPAATIMLGRDHKGIFEVLLLKRNKSLAFAGGLWVFPGGKIEADEIAETSTMLEAAKIAAIRETKEEADIDIQSDELIFTRHWTTPAVEPRRFATWFFFGGIQDNLSDVKIDDGEIKEYMWINPQVALDRFRTGKLAMLPPTFINLQLVRKCQSLTEAQQKLHNIEPVFVLPVVSFENDNYTILYKGDAGYDAADASLKGAKHRLIMQPAKRSVVFEYQGCDEYLPVNGGDDYFSS